MDPNSDGSTLDRVPRWSPDGALLYFTSNRDGFLCIWAQRLESASKRPVGNPFAVQHFHQARLGIQVQDTGLIGLSVARDKIVLALGETTGNIWVMEPH